MRLFLPLLAGLGASVALVGVVLYLRRSFLLVRRLTFPLVVASVAAGLKIYTLFQTAHMEVFEAILSWTLLFLPAVVVLRIAGLYIFEIHIRAGREIQLPPLMQPLTMAVIYLVTALVTLRIVFPDLDVGPLLTTSAITSLVLGLALQPILGNLFAGIVISLEKPFRIGDWVRAGEIEGKVVAITWRTTRLRTRENYDLILPNGKIAEEPIINYYYPHPLNTVKVVVGVDYRTPPYRVEQALLRCVAGVPGALEKPSPEVELLRFDDSAISYELEVWIENYAQAPQIGSALRSRIWEEFRKSDINIPFPIRTLELMPRPRPRPDAGVAPRAHVFVLDGPARGASLDLDGQPLTVGRAETCGLSLADALASKEHCRIEWSANGYMLTDLESKAGTRVNGLPTRRVRLANLDRIGVGGSTLVFEIDAI